MKTLDAFLQWRIVRGKKSATISVVEFDTPASAGKYLVDNKPDNKIVYVAELTPTPTNEVAEELPQGFGTNIKEAAEHLAVRLERMGKGYLLELQ